MAASYSCLANGVAWAASKNMLALFNASGSGKIIRLYRIWILTQQTGAVTGGTALLGIHRFTAVGTGGTTVAFLKHDTNSANVPAQITCVHGPTVITSTGLFRQIAFPTDEIVVSGATWEEIASLNEMGLIWDSGYYDTTTEPLVCREGEGIVLQTPAGGTYVGSATMNLEMTIT